MHRMWLGIVAFVCLLAMGAAQASESFGSKLREAESVRSSNPVRFQALLKQLTSERSAATPRELLELKYLQAYETAAYQDRISDGIGMAKEVYAATSDLDVQYKAGTLVANLSALTRDFSTGLRYLEKSMAVRSKVRDRQAKHSGMGSAAMLYNQMGQYRIGLRYANEVLAERPEPRMACFARSLQIEALYEIGSTKNLMSSVDPAITECRAIGERMATNVLRGIKAKLMASHGNVREAVALLEQSLPDVKDTHYPRLIAEIESILGEMKFKLGDMPGAALHSNAAVSLGNQVASSSSLVTAYHTLYEIAAKHERPTDALLLYKMYAEADKAHQSDVKARELAYEIVRNETQQKNKEIELLQQSNQVLRLRQTLERENAQKARLATIFLLIVLAGIVFWAVQIKRHHRQLQQLAQTDSLTGLGNRHFFTQMSEKSLVEAARAGEPAALVMFDLDHFKAINDTYGHGAGDWVLKQVGKTCSAHCRKIDYLGRIGGEEFAVLLRGIDLSGATRIAEDCRVQLAKIDTRECGYAFVVTGSFGVSSTAQSGYDLSRLLSHADQMLYRAKNEGRNRVCAYNADAAIDHRSGKRAPTLSIVNS